MDLALRAGDGHERRLFRVYDAIGSLRRMILGGHKNSIGCGATRCRITNQRTAPPRYSLPAEPEQCFYKATASDDRNAGVRAGRFGVRCWRNGEMAGKRSIDKRSSCVSIQSRRAPEHGQMNRYSSPWANVHSIIRPLCAARGWCNRAAVSLDLTRTSASVPLALVDAIDAGRVHDWRPRHAIAARCRHDVSHTEDMEVGK